MSSTQSGDSLTVPVGVCLIKKWWEPFSLLLSELGNNHIPTTEFLQSCTRQTLQSAFVCQALDQVLSLGVIDHISTSERSSQLSCDWTDERRINGNKTWWRLRPALWQWQWKEMSRFKRYSLIWYIVVTDWTLDEKEELGKTLGFGFGSPEPVEGEASPQSSHDTLWSLSITFSRQILVCGLHISPSSMVQVMLYSFGVRPST